MQIDYEAMARTLLAETEETLGQMEEALLRLETRPEDDDLLGLIFRVAHMLKGNAAGFGLEVTSGYAHVVESLLAPIRSHQVAINKEVISLLLRAADQLRELTSAEMAGRKELHPEEKDVLRRLQAAAAAAEPSQIPVATSSDQAEPAPATTVSLGTVGNSTLRVDVPKLDRLLNLAGEIGILQGRVYRLVEEQGPQSAEELVEAVQESGRLTMELHEQVMDLRMVPIGPMFHRYARVVRDIASRHGKLARLVVEGEEAGVDTAIIEHLRDPLLHMIRNSIDHGIELPNDRRAAGKPPVGTIGLRAFRDASTIVIELADDGAGLRRGKIAQRARELGLESDPERLPDAQLLQLIFAPGFSTAEQVTETSGRGVGMDIVRRNIEAMHGQIEIRSVEGHGTTVTLRMPLTLAIVQGFLVGVCGERYVLPLDAVTECLELPANCLPGHGGKGVMSLRGSPLPFIRLRNLFGLAGAPARENIVVVGYQGGSAGIVVDELHGEQQAVIKPLGTLFQNLPGISGSTILGDGKIALVLDVAGLYRACLSGSEPLPRPASGRETSEPRSATPSVVVHEGEDGSIQQL